MKPRKKIIIASASFAAFVIIFGFFALYPLISGIQKDSRNLLLQRGKAEESNSLERYIADFTGVSFNSKDEFEALGNLLVDQETPIQFIEFLEDIAKNSGFALKIAPGTPKQLKGEMWPSMEFQVSAKGTYPNFFVFLEKLESAPYLLEVKNITIAKVRAKASLEEQAAQKDIDFTLLLKVFTTPLRETREKT